jgi:hypothetical protein
MDDRRFKLKVIRLPRTQSMITRKQTEAGMLMAGQLFISAVRIGDHDTERAAVSLYRQAEADGRSVKASRLERLLSALRYIGREDQPSS